MTDFTAPDPLRAILSGHSPQEAAEPLTRLQKWYPAAWRAQHEARHTPEGESQFAAVSDLDRIRVDTLRATAGNGMRRPAESLADVTARAEREHQADTEAADPRVAYAMHHENDGPASQRQHLVASRAARAMRDGDRTMAGEPRSRSLQAEAG